MCSGAPMISRVFFNETNAPTSLRVVLDLDRPLLQTRALSWVFSQIQVSVPELPEADLNNLFCLCSR